MAKEEDKKEKEIKVIDKRRFRMEPDGTVVESEAEKKEEKKEAEKEEQERIDDGEEVALPPVDFKTFIASLATTALINLGHIPNPSTGETIKNLEVARYHIDTIDMLSEKTRGNLTEDEEEFLREILRDLKLRYIEESKRIN